jgi:hypothetical protein
LRGAAGPFVFYGVFPKGFGSVSLHPPGVRAVLVSLFDELLA